MRIKLLFGLYFIAGCGSIALSQDATKAVYKDPNATIPERVCDPLLFVCDLSNRFEQKSERV
jgi:hypothetical protein